MTVPYALTCTSCCVNMLELWKRNKKLDCEFFTERVACAPMLNLVTVLLLSRDHKWNWYYWMGPIIWRTYCMQLFCRWPFWEGCFSLSLYHLSFISLAQLSYLNYLKWTGQMQDCITEGVGSPSEAWYSVGKFVLSSMLKSSSLFLLLVSTVAETRRLDSSEDLTTKKALTWFVRQFQSLWSMMFSS